MTSIPLNADNNYSAMVHHHLVFGCGDPRFIIYLKAADASGRCLIVECRESWVCPITGDGDPDETDAAVTGNWLYYSIHDAIARLPSGGQITAGTGEGQFDMLCASALVIARHALKYSAFKDDKARVGHCFIAVEKGSTVLDACDIAAFMADITGTGAADAKQIADGFCAIAESNNNVGARRPAFVYFLAPFCSAHAYLTLVAPESDMAAGAKSVSSARDGVIQLTSLIDGGDFSRDASPALVGTVSDIVYHFVAQWLASSGAEDVVPVNYIRHFFVLFSNDGDDVEGRVSIRSTHGLMEPAREDIVAHVFHEMIADRAEKHAMPMPTIAAGGQQPTNKKILH